MRKLALFAIFTIAILSVSCKSRTQKMHEFVNGFNQTAMMSYSGTSGTQAKVEGLDVIELNLASPLDINDPTASQSAQLMISALPAMFQREESMMDLINEGVKFKVRVIDTNGRIITDALVDKPFLDKTKQGSPINDGQSPEETAISALNASLPLKYEDGSRLMKIERTSSNELTYTLEMPADMQEILKSPNAEPLLKESLKSDPSTQNTLRRMRGIGITKVTYKLITPEGKSIQSMSFNASEF
ncbi:hypothetical protein [Flavobacterium sp.]|uniref:hypothetical protein n=1 Tax=Flavobacterium sp. TaxID=239 RepID=UPI002613BA6E|nr:hypothetical protein [Flavobacterium sp.]